MYASISADLASHLKSAVSWEYICAECKHMRRQRGAMLMSEHDLLFKHAPAMELTFVCIPMKTNGI